MKKNVLHIISIALILNILIFSFGVDVYHHICYHCGIHSSSTLFSTKEKHHHDENCNKCVSTEKHEAECCLNEIQQEKEITASDCCTETVEHFILNLPYSLSNTEFQFLQTIDFVTDYINNQLFRKELIERIELVKLKLTKPLKTQIKNIIYFIYNHSKSEDSHNSN